VLEVTRSGLPDMRFAIAKKAILSHFEVGAGSARSDDGAAARLMDRECPGKCCWGQTTSRAIGEL